MLAWLGAYLLTCAVEIPTVVVLLRALGWRDRGRHPLVCAVFLAWVLQVTHPMLWALDPAYPGALLLAEGAIVAVEAAGIYVWAVLRADAGAGLPTASRALLVSLIANGSSLALGVALALAAPTLPTASVLPWR